MFIQNLPSSDPIIAHVTNKGSCLLDFMQVHMSFPIFLQSELLIALGTRVVLLVSFVFHVNVRGEAVFTAEGGFPLAVGAVKGARRAVSFLHMLVPQPGHAKRAWTEGTGDHLLRQVGYEVIFRRERTGAHGTFVGPRGPRGDRILAGGFSRWLVRLVGFI